ncbi:SDR family oxidoreductase [Micromonospora craniellae]|uniref:SDR family oxidoreductase n=1 Tax=Micromonospora craniellae TaxID=2294034 RepID=A0A372FT24_9ACTN|nr:SDR family oxidoreductase [Micromonospora craniellae]
MAGRRVLVAGAGGLGGAVLTALTELGCVCAAVDRSAETLRAAATSHPDLHTHVADLTDRSAVRAAVDELVGRLGGLDVAVHAVGVNDRRPILSVTPDGWRDLLAVNLDSAFHFAQVTGGIMTAQGDGRLILFSSVAGTLAHRDHGPYAASKGALNQLARVMANEWAPYGVTVNTIAPGYTPTGLTRQHLARPGVEETLTGLVPSGRLGAVDDVQGIVALLASPRSAYLTGQVIHVDGGRTLV